MDLMNPFSVFTVAELSEAMSVLPNMYGRMNELGIFEVKGLRTNTVAIEEKGGSLVMLPTHARGAPGPQGKTAKRKLRTFTIPQITEEEGIDADEVLGLRGFGGNQLASLQDLVTDKLMTARSKHDITLEFMRMGALNGVLVDGAGVTLYNFFTEFAITEKVIDFAFTNANLDVRNICMNVCRHIEDNITGDVYTNIRAEVSPEWFDAFVAHASVKDAFKGYAEARRVLGGDLRNGFEYGGITFYEYRGNATDFSGNNQKFIPANTGRAYPLGTRQTFRTFVAPADFNETVNQVGQLYYAKIAPRKFDRGYDAHTQSNPFPICMRPQVLVKLTKS
jgi:hypothetical protein